MSVVATLNLGSALNALSLNRSSRLVAVGGREVLKVVEIDLEAIDDDRKDSLLVSSSSSSLSSQADKAFAPSNGSGIAHHGGGFDDIHSLEVLSLAPPPPSPVVLRVVSTLRKGRGNLNWSVNDIKWHPMHPWRIATAATNGAVVVWDITPSGGGGTTSGRAAISTKKKRRKTKKGQRLLLKEHSGTVNRLCWHPFPQIHPELLLSASQDSSIKLWDTRTGKSTDTIRPQSSAVRDACFSLHNATRFVSAHDDGRVHVWDMRSTRFPVCSVLAHNGPVLSLALHPTEAGVFASGGRDKMINIWSIEGQTLERDQNVEKGQNLSWDHEVKTVREDGNNARISTGVGSDGLHGNPTMGRFAGQTEGETSLKRSQRGGVGRFRLGTKRQSSHFPRNVGSRGRGSCAVNLLNPIQTIASVSTLSWRYGMGDEIASASSVIDNTVSVWDIRRPFLPRFSLRGHKDTVAGMEWLRNARPVTEARVPRRRERLQDVDIEGKVRVKGDVYGHEDDYIANRDADEDYYDEDRESGDDEETADGRAGQYLVSCSKDGHLALQAVYKAHQPGRGVCTAALSMGLWGAAHSVRAPPSENFGKMVSEIAPGGGSREITRRASSLSAPVEQPLLESLPSVSTRFHVRNESDIVSFGEDDTEMGSGSARLPAWRQAFEALREGVVHGTNEIAESRAVPAGKGGRNMKTASADSSSRSQSSAPSYRTTGSTSSPAIDTNADANPDAESHTEIDIDAELSGAQFSHCMSQRLLRTMLQHGETPVMAAALRILGQEGEEREKEEHKERMSAGDQRKTRERAKARSRGGASSSPGQRSSSTACRTPLVGGALNFFIRDETDADNLDASLHDLPGDREGAALDEERTRFGSGVRRRRRRSSDHRFWGGASLGVAMGDEDDDGGGDSDRRTLEEEEEDDEEEDDDDEEDEEEDDEDAEDDDDDDDEDRDGEGELGMGERRRRGRRERKGGRGRVGQARRTSRNETMRRLKLKQAAAWQRKELVSVYADLRDRLCQWGEDPSIETGLEWMSTSSSRRKEAGKGSMKEVIGKEGTTEQEVEEQRRQAQRQKEGRNTMFYDMCTSCRKPLAGNVCSQCGKTRGICAICELPVKGVFVWCQGCGHGGHLHHMIEWFRQQQQGKTRRMQPSDRKMKDKMRWRCPVRGCGHTCTMPSWVAHSGGVDRVLE